eukprot:jgi/Chrzof1/4623/Cz14g20110.t1
MHRTHQVRLSPTSVVVFLTVFISLTCQSTVFGVEDKSSWSDRAHEIKESVQAAAQHIGHSGAAPPHIEDSSTHQSLSPTATSDPATPLMDPDVDSNSHNLEAAYNEAVQVISDAQKRVSHLTKDKGSAAVDEAVAAVAKAERYLQDWGHSLLSGAQDAHGASMGTLQEVMQKFKQAIPTDKTGNTLQSPAKDATTPTADAVIQGLVKPSQNHPAPHSDQSLFHKLWSAAWYVPSKALGWWVKSATDPDDLLKELQNGSPGGLAQQVGGKVSDAASAMQQSASDVGDNVADKAEQAVNAGSDAVADAASSVQQGVQDAADAAGQSLGNSKDTAKHAAKKGKKSVEPIVDATAKKAKAGANSAIESVKEASRQAGDAAADASQTAQQVIKGKQGKVKHAVDDTASRMKEGACDAADMLEDGYCAVSGAASNAGQNIADSVKGNLSKASERSVDAGYATADMAQRAYDQMMEKLSGLASYTAASSKKGGKKVQHDAEESAKKLSEGLQGLQEAAENLRQYAVNGPGQRLKGMAKDGADAGMDAVKGAAHMGQKGWQASKDTAKDAVDQVHQSVDQASEVVNDAADKAKAYGSSAKDTAADAVKQTQDTVKDAATASGQRVSDTAQQTADSAKKAGKKAGRQARDAVKQAEQAAADVASSVQDKASEAAQQTKGKVSGAAQQTKGSVSDAAQQTNDKVTDATQQTKHAAAHGVGAAKESVGVVGNLLQAMSLGLFKFGATTKGAGVAVTDEVTAVKDAAADQAHQSGSYMKDAAASAASKVSDASKQAVSNTAQQAKDGVKHAVNEGVESAKGAGGVVLNRMTGGLFGAVYGYFNNPPEHAHGSASKHSQAAKEEALLAAEHAQYAAEQGMETAKRSTGGLVSWLSGGLLGTKQVNPKLRRTESQKQNVAAGAAELLADSASGVGDAAVQAAKELEQRAKAVEDSTRQKPAKGVLSRFTGGLFSFRSGSREVAKPVKDAATQKASPKKAAHGGFLSRLTGGLSR